MAEESARRTPTRARTPPITREIDGAVYCRFLLDIEGAPIHRFLSPAAAERAMRAARIRHHGAAGNYWIHFGDWESEPGPQPGPPAAQQGCMMGIRIGDLLHWYDGLAYEVAACLDRVESRDGCVESCTPPVFCRCSATPATPTTRSPSSRSLPAMWSPVRMNGRAIRTRTGATSPRIHGVDDGDRVSVRPD